MCLAEWYVLGSRYITHCSKSNVGGTKHDIFAAYYKTQ